MKLHKVLFVAGLVLLLAWFTMLALANPAFAEQFTRLEFVRGVESGIVWQKSATNPKVVSGITSYKDGSVSPNRLWLYSNYTLTGAPTVGVEPSGEIVLVTKSGTGKTILVRVSAEGEGAKVSIEGGPLYVDSLYVGNIQLNESNGKLQVQYPDGTMRTIKGK